MGRRRRRLRRRGEDASGGTPSSRVGGGAPGPPRGREKTRVRHRRRFMGRQRFLPTPAGGGRWPHGRFFTHARLPVVVAASIVPTTYGTRARPPAVDLRCHCCSPTRPPPDPVRPAAVRLPQTPPPFRHPCHHVTGGGRHEEQAGAGPDARRYRRPHMPVRFSFLWTFFLVVGLRPPCGGAHPARARAAARWFRATPSGTPCGCGH